MGVSNRQVADKNFFKPSMVHKLVNVRKKENDLVFRDAIVSLNVNSALNLTINH
jgi:hypothetical protein